MLNNNFKENFQNLTKLEEKKIIKKNLWKNKATSNFNFFLKMYSLKKKEKSFLQKFWLNLTSIWSNCRYILLRYLCINFQSFSSWKEKKLFKKNNKEKLSFFKDLEGIINDDKNLFFFLKNLAEVLFKEKDLNIFFLKNTFTKFFKKILVEKKGYSKESFHKKVFFFENSLKDSEISSNLISLKIKVISLKKFNTQNALLIKHCLKKFCS